MSRGALLNVVLVIVAGLLLYEYFVPQGNRNVLSINMSVNVFPHSDESTTGGYNKDRPAAVAYTPRPALSPVKSPHLVDVKKPLRVAEPVHKDSKDKDNNNTDGSEHDPGIQTYPPNENEVELSLPPMESLPAAVADPKSTPLTNDDEAMNIGVAIGVLTAPSLMRTRLIPLLETSLRNEKNVFIFYEDNITTKAGRDAIEDYVKSVGREKEVNIIALPPLPDMKMSIRNSWVDIPAALYMKRARPELRWFGIMDDDTYLLMNAVRKILWETQQNVSNVGIPTYLGTPLTWGACTGWRVIRDSRTGKRNIQPTSKRKPVSFVCGGSGVFLDMLALNELEKKAQYCIKEMFHPAGDVRLGLCMNESNVPIIARRELFRDTVFRAIGEKAVHLKHRFPASFHRLRYREWFYALGAVERARRPNELITWGDLILNFPVGPRYWDSLFRPMSYPNYTVIFGLRTQTPQEKKRERILKRLGYPKCKHEDEF